MTKKINNEAIDTAIELTEKTASLTLKGAVQTAELTNNYVEGMYVAGYNANVEMLKVAKNYWDATLQIRQDWIQLFSTTGENLIKAAGKLELPLQKEVVEKFTARVGDKAYGPVAIKWHFLAQNIESFAVSAGSFSPPPKVQSAVLSFARSEKSALIDPRVNKPNYISFSRFLSQSFLNRRKKYVHALRVLKASKALQEQYGSFRSEQLKPIELFDIWESTL